MILPGGTCSVCGGLVPNNLISCPRCAIDKDEIAQRIIQIPMIARAVKGEIEIRIYRDDKMVKHIAKWGYDLCFCGQPTKNVRLKERRSYLWIDEDSKEWNRLCEKCRAAFNILAKEASTFPPAA